VNRGDICLTHRDAQTFDRNGSMRLGMRTVDVHACGSPPPNFPGRRFRSVHLPCRIQTSTRIRM